jgi:hypothetical protein
MPDLKPPKVTKSRKGKGEIIEETIRFRESPKLSDSERPTKTFLPCRQAESIGSFGFCQARGFVHPVKQI